MELSENQNPNIVFFSQVFPHPDIHLTEATRPHKLVSHLNFMEIISETCDLNFLKKYLIFDNIVSWNLTGCQIERTPSFWRLQVWNKCGKNLSYPPYQSQCELEKVKLRNIPWNVVCDQTEQKLFKLFFFRSQWLYHLRRHQQSQEAKPTTSPG